MRYQIQIYTQRPNRFLPPSKKNRANKPGIWDTRNYFDYSDKAIKICFTGGVFASVIPELMGIHGISLLRMVLSLVSSVTSESGLIPQAKRCFLLESCKLANPDNFFFSQEKLENSKSEVCYWEFRSWRNFIDMLKNQGFFPHNTETVILFDCYGREDLLSSNDCVCHPDFTTNPKLFLHLYQMAWLTSIKQILNLAFIT